MEQNKNLSDIVNSIEDEGPSLYANEDLPEDQTANKADRKEDGGKATGEPEIRHRRSKRRGLGYWLMLGIAIAVIGLGAVFGVRNYFPGWPKSADTVGTRMSLAAPNGNQQLSATGLQALQAKQSEIEARLKELTDNVAGIKDNSNKRWIANEAALDQVREYQRQELSSISQAIASIQLQLNRVEPALAKPAGGRTDLPVVQPINQQTVQPVPMSGVEDADQAIIPQIAPEITPQGIQNPDITGQVVQNNGGGSIPQASREDTRENAREAAAQADPGTIHKTVQQLATDSPNVEEWVVNLALLTKEASADRLMTTLQRMNVIGQRTVVTIRGRQMYRIRALGFPTKAEAQSHADHIGDKLGIHDAWVSRR